MMENSNSINDNNSTFFNTKKEVKNSAQEDPNFLKLNAANQNKSRSFEKYSQGMGYMNAAMENVRQGNYSVASVFLKDFANVTGEEDPKLIRAFGGYGKKIPENMKNLQLVRDRYNMSTIQQIITESNKKGFNIQANLYTKLFDTAQKASIIPKASVEVSNMLQQILSKVKYINRNPVFIQKDIQQIEKIKEKYEDEYNALKEQTLSSLKEYPRGLDYLIKLIKK